MANIYCSTTYDDYNFKSVRKYREDGIYEPFVYIIEEIDTGMLYIGSKTASKCLELDLGKNYFTSSKYINWVNGSFEIVKIYSCMSNHDALILEGILLDKNFAVYDEHYYNRQNSGVNFNMCGVAPSDETRKKLSAAGKRRIFSEETKAKMSKSKKLYKPSKESIQKMSESLTGRELSEETKKKISVNNGWKGRKRPIFVCPHCNKEGSGGAMNRWHFDQCRYKPR